MLARLCLATIFFAHMAWNYKKKERGGGGREEAKEGDGGKTEGKKEDRKHNPKQ